MAVVQLGGVTVAVAPEPALSAAERALLARLAASASPMPSDRSPGPFHLNLAAAPVVATAPRAPSAPAPATVSTDRGRLLVQHSAFSAELDPRSGHGRLWRAQPDGAGLLVTLRVALAATLPLRGGLPLHAAGVVAQGRGLCFFGPSGAGKSTLASTALERGLSVLSDEQVSVYGDPPVLGASGFWGAADGEQPAAAAPLAALFELDRGPELRLEPLPPPIALRRLLVSLLVPPQPELWTAALAVAAALVRAVPAYRIAWTPDAPPWDALCASLAPGLPGVDARAAHRPQGCAARGTARA